MPELRQFTLIWLTVALVAQLVTHLRHGSWISTGATVWVALAISLLVAPLLKRHEPLRLALVLMMTVLSMYRLLLIQDNPVADTLGLMVTTVLWRSFLDDEGPHLRRRLLVFIRSSARHLSRPVMPLPLRRGPEMPGQFR